MLRIVKRWPTTAILILLHAWILLAITVLFYTSHDPERGFIWIYGILASYPSSLSVTFLTRGGQIMFAAVLLLIGTLQWAIIGVAIDAVIHHFRREATSNTQPLDEANGPIAG